MGEPAAPAVGTSGTSPRPALLADAEVELACPEEDGTTDGIGPLGALPALFVLPVPTAVAAAGNPASMRYVEFVTAHIRT